MSDFAPIALFVYNRPVHTRRTLEALAANPEASGSFLYVFADGPKKGATNAALVDLEQVRVIIRERAWCREVCIVESNENRGLAASIVHGVTSVVEKHGRAIVMEDDLITSPHFLCYMNEALNLYQDDSRVASIHGYNLPLRGRLPETFFLRGADCWGWGVWKRSWQHFNPDPAALLEEIESRGLSHAFDFDGAYPYCGMLRDRIAGRNNSWAVCWHASAFLKEMLTLYPGKSLVRNIGFDSSGTHCDLETVYDVELVAGEHVNIARIPCSENIKMRNCYVDFHRGSHFVGGAYLSNKVADLLRFFLSPLKRMVVKLRLRPS